MPAFIDLNCDMGESWYDRQIGQDEALMPLISSCNLACGIHGGDPKTRHKSLQLAAQYGVAIGAHPSLPGHHNFGREAVDIPAVALFDLLLTQVQGLQQEARSLNQALHHLKPHGALYHLAAKESKEASIVVEVCQRLQIPMIYGLPGSELEKCARAAGLQFVAEGFVDRAYENGQALRPRSLAGAVIQDSALAAAQALQLAKDHVLVDYYGRAHALQVQTLCIHGDHPEALDHLMALRELLKQHQLTIKAPEA